MSDHHHEESEEGESWLMSYADLITVLLAVFVLLFSLSSVDSAKSLKITAAISQYLNTKTVPTEVASDVTLIDRELQALRLLTTFLDLGHPDEVLEKLLAMVDKPKELEKLRSLAERMGVLGEAKLAKPEYRYEVVVPNRLLYRKNSAQLSPEGVTFVQSIAPTLKNVLKDGDRLIEIEGHTDSMPLPPDSDYSSNNILSAARAEAVSLLLVKNGIPEQLIRIVGKGSSEPLFEERNSDGSVNADAREKNARVTIAVRTLREE